MKTLKHSLLLTTTFLILLSIKINSQVFEWAKSISSSQGDVTGSGISVDANGNSYIVGDFTGTADFGTTQLTSFGVNDVFIAKYDPNGNCLWARHGGGKSYDYGFGISVDAIGNSYITGIFFDTVMFGAIQLIDLSSGYTDLFIAKYDPNGNCLWAINAGGMFSDVGYGVSADKTGSVYVTGKFAASASFGTKQLTSYGSYDIFLAKFDANGNCLWAKNAGGIGEDIGQGISTIPNGNNCVITGLFRDTAKFGANELISAGMQDMFIAKYDPNGNCVWARQGGGSDQDQGTSVFVDPFGKSYVTGTFNSFASFGTIQLASQGFSDVFTAYYDVYGNCSWAKQAGGPYTDESFGISVSKTGNIYITGDFYGTAVFGTHQLTSNGVDIFVVKYDPDGNSFWAKQAGGESTDNGFDITTDTVGNVYLTGRILTSAAFDTTHLNVNQFGAFVAKIVESPVGIKNELTSIPADYSLSQNYPNPFNPSTTIKFSLPKEVYVTVNIYNSMGEDVSKLISKEMNPGEYTTEWNASGFSSGVYFYRIVADNFIQTKKLLLIK